MNLLDTTAAVVTPERVQFRYRLAGPGRRAIAWTIDAAIRLVVVMFVGVIVALLAAIPGLDGIGTGALLVVLFVLEWVYGVFFETILGGRTPGKFLLALRVVREDGAPARFPDFLLRNLLRAVDYLPGFFAIGLASMFLDRRLRRVGDLVGGTVVVVEERDRVRDRAQIDPPVSEEERQALPAGVHLSREELSVLESFVRRRSRLSPERAEELAWLYGPALSERTGVTAPTWERVLVLAYARATGRDR
ncbi:MAG: RDD family protein [Deltaproteobacteria bacterium]|nr:MAG: RDD family protein [Deltaproteobacteria bacterium]